MIHLPALLLAMVLPALAIPSLGEGAQQITVQVVGTDQPVIAEWVGVGRLPLAKELSTWEGNFHSEPSRFLQLRIWEMGTLLWEGTLFLTDRQADTFCFRVVDLPPRTLLRVATIAPPPKIGSMPMDGFGMIWALTALLLVLGAGGLGFLQRRRGA